VNLSLNFLRLFIFAALFALTGCDKSLVYEENFSVQGDAWKVSEPFTFTVEVSDTISPCNFYLNVRHSDAYPFSNLFVFLNTRFPNGKFARDTVELMLQNPEGKWTGSGLGDMYDNQIMFKRGLRFPLKGTYVFKLEQAMRTPELPMIKEMGLRIEKSDSNN
jgi:gliding motility-associated lipoprotein GldH